MALMVLLVDSGANMPALVLLVYLCFWIYLLCKSGIIQKELNLVTEVYVMQVPTLIFETLLLLRILVWPF
jgi:hypothetical protein